MNARSHADDERKNEFNDAIRETLARISRRGVYLHGDETPDEIVELDEALEQFERAVQSRGGDLMVDEAPPGHRGEPDDPRFLLPKRETAMPVSAYIDRLARAVDGMRRKGKA